MRLLRGEFGFVFWIHLFIIAIVLLSPFLFSWYFIILGIIIHVLQTLVFNGCIVTYAQFGTQKDMTFYYHYLKMLGINFNKRKLNLFLTWKLPWIILAFALIWQIILEIKPIWF